MNDLYKWINIRVVQQHVVNLKKSSKSLSKIGSKSERIFGHAFNVSQIT
ncbi:hypothetical protein MNV_2190010 [Candidatus Methanoperedens nitroreducens]|uniref:Uncharacterized protein n=1 Tax=Candidatus Methanoperedens nitratireducens TaxID=1392998 RepID=A0A284VP05_9EURY|nr:hypothetical protein MNV_2190010 [Candidatus Methanoperedens nitroreducens]